ncbi:exonuclease domain-containing protein [Desulfococcaceae bacterium HSG8]|nr:exonuclease domain-containing protein [Desulfococcaceae bacterium HSG8]
MNPKNKFWWFAGTSIAFTFVIIGAIAILFWKQLSPEEQNIVADVIKSNFGYIFTAVFLMLAALGFGLDGIVHNYIIPMHKLVEEATLINSVNPSHRINFEGSRDSMRLAQIINDGADSYEVLQRNVEQKIRTAKAEAEEEKNILASFMAELPDGVVICNSEGQILLYNRQAKQYLECGISEAVCEDETSSEIDKAGQFIGLGRSIFGVVEKNLIVHALDEIADKLEREEAHAASYFVVAGMGDRFLRAEAVPVLSQKKQFTGFILILHDITRQLEADNRIGCLMESFTRGIRSSLASIRSAIEAVLEYPGMDSGQLNVFSNIIYNESVNMSNFLDKAEGDYSCEIKTQWPLVQMSDRELAEMIRRRAEEKLGVKIKIESSSDEENRIKADSYSMVSAMLFVIDRLKGLAGTEKFTCLFEKEGRFLNLDLLWKGSPVKIETLREWDNQRLTVENEGISLTLKEVLGHHEAEIWSHSCKASEGKSYFRIFKRSDESRAYLRLLLPIVEISDPDGIRNIMIMPESRPEFYDFDLFDQADQSSEFDNRPLTELAYTVFDTETTGLDPKGGDEIISIGCVRIVNCRLLREESFDQLIDPRRSVPPESTKIHGIHPEMLEGQPVIEKILPLFQKFAEDTIFVGHNAAFDMRMLQMKEEVTGIKFTNPVVDTLLLSAVVHPTQEAHSMEAIAARLGVSIVGRHTALGDAIVTGEIFLKLIPLLAKKGIHTLKEARFASQKTYYARLKY